MSEKHIPGMGCKCNAWSESECGCDGVDWRSKREVELEAKVSAAGAAFDALYASLKESGVSLSVVSTARLLTLKAALEGKQDG